MVNRLAGWEQRLDRFIAEACAWRYELGTHDCFRLACGAIEAVTGADRWPEACGYRTRREMFEMLARWGSTFEDAGDRFFGVARATWRLARRGDIAAFEAPSGVKHLGVVKDHRIMFLREDGVLWLPLPAALCAWRIG